MERCVLILESASGSLAPLAFAGLFLAASLLMLWRLEAMSRRGFEGTVLGTLVMPYCSGLGNLVFAFMLGRQGGSGEAVMENVLVNNITNLTLLLGLPALLWGMSLAPPGGRRRAAKQHAVNRLSLMLTLTAGLFFTGAVWALGRDGRLDFGDGLVLAGLFLFWQVFHVFEVLKANVRENRGFDWILPLDFVLLVIGAAGIYVSIEWLVAWVSQKESGLFSADYMGWLSGWLMVLPNALLALYYAWRGKPEVVYSSQAGDGHICIPLCLGIFALQQPLNMPGLTQQALGLLVVVLGCHLALVALCKGFPRWFGAVWIAAYALFLYRGLSL